MLLTVLFSLFRLVISLRLCDESPAKSLLRVIGGSATSIGDYPWQAAVVYYDGSDVALMCGATVIDEYWILTAAHCIMKNPERAFILTGLRSLHDPQHTHHVERAVIHPGYDENTIANDIALVKSEFPLLTTGVSSVCFAKEDSSLLHSKSEAIVVGFGIHIVSQSTFELTMGVSDVVLTTTLPIISQSQCRREWADLTGGAVLISDKQLCAGSKLHGTAPGDSGGPLLVRDRLGRLVQVGITSFGAGGFQGLVDQSTYPGVYTRVSPYIKWMEQVTSSGTTQFPLFSVIFITSVICIYESMELIFILL